MTGSGSLFSDALLMLLQIYVFKGGWIASLGGLALCFASKVQGATWARVSLTAIACLIPPALLVGGSLVVDALPWIDSNDLAIWIAVGLAAVLTLSGPIAALRLFLCTSGAPRPRT
jgi:hypothetical protein